MDFFHILALAIIQGITEFLPVSSSAHLVLLPIVGGIEDQGLAFDVAIHIGSLLAVVLYFRREIVPIVVDSTNRYILGKPDTVHSDLGKHIAIATLPIILIGWLMVSYAMNDLRDPKVIAMASILFGLLLWYSDSRGSRNRQIESMNVTDALVIGLLQAFAIIPGTSRSGITITAGLLLGYDRIAASRFSFLLAVPTILLSGVLLGYKIVTTGAETDWTAILIGTACSFLFAYMAIHYFLKLIDRTGMLPYVIYRVILGIILLAIFL